MEMIGVWCGKCDYETMIDGVEDCICGNYESDLNKLNNKMPYCKTCGARVSVIDNETYYYENIHNISENLEEAIDSLEHSINWFKNLGYVKSRILICEETLKSYYKKKFR